MIKRRTFSIEEKLALLQEAEEVGITETCRRHDLSHSVINRWRKKFEEEGVDGLKAGSSQQCILLSTQQWKARDTAQYICQVGRPDHRK